MTYKKLFYLKYKVGMPTLEIAKLYPSAAQQVNEIALLDLPEPTLRELLGEDESLNRLIRLKRRLSRLL